MNNIDQINIDEFFKAKESEFHHICDVIEKALENQPETNVLVNLAVAGWLLSNSIAGAMKAVIEMQDPNTILNLKRFIEQIIESSISKGESMAWGLVNLKKRRRK